MKQRKTETRLKRFLSLALALLMVFSMMPQITLGASAANLTGGEKLYLTPNSNWKKDNARFAIYVFGNGEAWASMTKVAGETDLYEVTVPSGNWTNVIFCRMSPSASANNWNNRWNQTADLTWDGSKNHYTVKAGTWDKGGGTWSVYAPETVEPETTVPETTVPETTTPETETPVVEKVTVYCVNSNKWATVSAHCWNDGGASTEWPGVAMTKTGDTVNGFDVYSVAVDKTYTSIIFNNSSNGLQTANLTLEEGEYYDVKSDTWYASLNDIPAVDPLATDASLPGSFNAWNATNSQFKLTAAGATTATVTLTLEANKTYEFKVVNNGFWLSTSTAITGDASGLQFSSTVLENATITTADAGEYVFTYDLSANTLAVAYPAAEPEETEPEAPAAISVENTNGTLLNMFCSDNEQHVAKFGFNPAYCTVSGSGYDANDGFWTEITVNVEAWAAAVVVDEASALYNHVADESNPKTFITTYWWANDAWVPSGYQDVQFTCPVTPPVATTYEVATKADLDAALAAAQDGDTIKLTADINCGSAALKIENAITLDLGGKTLTTSGRNYSLSLHNDGIIVTNGKLVHAGTVAAIKVWNAAEISNLEIDVTGTSSSGYAIGGIVIQQNAAGVDTIKNVKIYSTAGQGIANGIETNNCGNATEPVIGSMENVTIDAVGTALNISAPCGTATGCSFSGGKSGIEIWIKGTYSATLELVDCDVAGGKQAVYAHDEFSSADIENNGTLALTADNATTFAATSGAPLTLTIARAENVDETVINKLIDTTVAKVGDTYYVSVANALAAANEDGTSTVTVLKDTDEVAEFPVGTTLIIPEGVNAPNVTVAERIPEGRDFTGYTGADAIWGETWGNAKESFVIKVLDADGNVMGTTSLNNVGGIIDGDVEVTWNLKLDAASNTDEYWTMEWTTAPTIDNQPAKVELWVDGVKVSGGNVVLNGPDDLNKIYAAEVDADGKITEYCNLDTFVSKIGDLVDRRIVVLRDVSFSSDKIRCVEFISGIEGGVTVTNTDVENWIDFDFVTIGKGVTVNVELPFSGDSENVIEGTLNAGDTYYHGYDAKTTIQNGGNVHVGGTTILRYNENADAGIYVYGDGDDSTVEFDCDYYIGAYSGTFYAENANIETGYFLLKNSYDNSSYADIDMTLDGSSLTVVGTTDTQDSFIIDDQASLTLKNGSAIKDVRDFNILAGTNLTLSVDESSSISATYVNVAEGVGLEATKNEDGTVTFKKILKGTGTEEDPILINDLADLILFRDTVNTYTQDGSNQFKGKYVKLTADIDLAGINWEPIGTNSVGDHSAFLGIFDGDGHTISNLYVNSDGDHLGFFARVGSYAEGITPTVKNLKFHNVDVSSNTLNGHNGSYVGGVIANAGGNSVVSNVTVTGDVKVAGYGYVGGIVGHGYPDLTNCHVKANDGSYVKAYYWCAGGIIGYAGEGGTPIVNCSVSGLDIWSAYGAAAAVAGLLQDGNKVENVSASNVEITSNSDYCMGYIAGNGECSTLTNVKIENVTATANGKPITATDAVAYIGETPYFSLQDAAEAVKSGETIKLMNDATGDATIPGGVTLNGNGNAVNGTITAGGNLTFAGETKVTSFNPGYYNHVITIGEGASLEITGTGRMTWGWGNTFNITGTIENAKTADKSAVKASLIVPAGVSITGSGYTLNVTNAYISLGGTSSKNNTATDTFNINFTNSIADFTDYFTLSAPTNGKTPVFNMNIKDSVVNVTKKMCIAAADSTVTIDNSTVTLGTYLHNSGELTLKNGSALTGSTIQYGENGGNGGTINVDASELTITCTSEGHAFDGNGTGKLNLTNGATANITYIKNHAEIVLDNTSSLTVTKLTVDGVLESSGDITGTIVAGENAEISIYAGTYTMDVKEWCALGYTTKDNGDGTWTVKAAVEAKIGNKPYATLAEAFAAAKEGDRILLQADAIVDKVLTVNHNITLADYDTYTVKFIGDGAIHITGSNNLNLENVILTAPVYADSNTAGATIGNAVAITGVEAIKSTVVSDGETVTVTNPKWVADVNGTVYYLTIDEAIKGAVADDTVNIYAGEYNQSISVNKDITVVGETDENGNNLVKLNGGISITADGATVKNLTASNPATSGYNHTLSINAKDVLVEGCEITDYNGVRYGYTSGTVTFKDSVITGTLYGIHFDGSAGGNIVIDNCVITGWTSFAGTIEKVAMKDTTFAEGIYNYVRFYQDEVVMEDCTFNDNMKVDIAVSGATVNVTNPTFNGEIENLFNASDIDASDIYVDGVRLITPEASINGVEYDTFAEAIAAAKDGDEVKVVMAGTYKVPTGKNITVTGAVDGVVFDNIGACGMGGASVTFNNVTFDYLPNTNYTGLQHSGNMVYNNCTINGQVFLYGTSETFNNCTFNQTSADAYNVWTYGAKEVAFNECTFNSAGKSVLIYSEQKDLVNDVTVTDCDFIASAPVDGKAAIEMDSSLTSGINLTIDAETTATGFGTGNVSGNSLWNNKKWDSTDANNDITVVVGTETVLAPVVFVAKIGEIGYTDLQDAIAAVENAGTIELLTDVEISETLYVNYNSAFDKITITINGNGHTIKAVGEGWTNKMHMVDIAWNVTLNDVTFDGNNTGCRGVQFYTSSSTLNNVTVKNISADLWSWTDYAIHANASDLTVTGTLTFENCKYGNLHLDIGSSLPEGTVSVVDTASATLKGAKIVLEGANTSATAKRLHVRYAAAELNGTYYGVLADAIALAQVDDQLVLMADAEKIELTKSINLDVNGKTVGEFVLTAADVTLTAEEGLNVTTAVEDHKVVYANGVYSVERKPNADITYGIYDVETTGEAGTESYRERMAVDLYNVYAKESLVVELWSGETKLSTTTLRESDRDDATVKFYPYSGDITANIVIAGRLAGSWDTEWHVAPSVYSLPDSIKVYADGELVATWNGGFMNEEEAENFGELPGVEKPFKLVGANILLSDSLKMYFYVNNADLEGEDYYAEIRRTFADGTADEVIKIPYSQWEVAGSSMHRFGYAGLAAKEMTDELYVTIYSTDGTAASQEWEDSIKAYAMRQLNSSDDARTKTLMVDLLNYGAAAQDYFDDYSINDLANADLTAEQKAYATQTVTPVDNREKGINYAGSTLSLKSSIVLTMYFENLGTDMHAEVTYTDHYGNEEKLTVEGKNFAVRSSGKLHGVNVTSLAVADGKQLVTCVVYDADGNEVARAVDSVESYIARMANGTEPVYEMIMKFVTSAIAYFEK